MLSGLIVLYWNGMGLLKANFFVTGLAKPLSSAGKGVWAGFRLQAAKTSSGSATNDKCFLIIVSFRC